MTQMLDGAGIFTYIYIHLPQTWPCFVGKYTINYLQNWAKCLTGSILVCIFQHHWTMRIASEVKRVAVLGSPRSTIIH